MSDICSICLKSNSNSFTQCDHVYCGLCILSLYNCVVCGLKIKEKNQQQEDMCNNSECSIS